MKIVAMIPARLGSQRIPKKNIRYFGEMPLLAHAIELAKKSDCFSEVWVNSESEVLGDLARQHEVHFHKRPEELSTNKATNQQFVLEFMQKHECDFLVMLNSTSPLLSEATVKRFCQFLREDKFESVMSTLEEQAESFYQDKPLNFSTERKINSQDLEPINKVVWAMTAWRRDSYMQDIEKGGAGIFHGRLSFFAIPKDESCDLDTEEDWRIAEGIWLARQQVDSQPKYWSPEGAGA